MNTRMGELQNALTLLQASAQAPHSRSELSIRLEKITTAREFFEFIIFASETPLIINQVRALLGSIRPTPGNLPQKVSFDVCNLANLSEAEVTEENFVSIQANRNFLGGRYAKLSVGNRHYGRGKGKAAFIKAEH